MGTRVRPKKGTWGLDPLNMPSSCQASLMFRNRWKR